MQLTNQYLKLFTIHNAATGALQDADQLPGAVLFKNGNLIYMDLTVTKMFTGVYRAQSVTTFQAFGSWAADDVVSCLVSALVDTVLEQSIISNDVLSSSSTILFEADVKVVTVDGHLEKIWYVPGTNTVLLTKKMRLLNGDLAVDSKHPVCQFTQG